MPKRQRLYLYTVDCQKLLSNKMNNNQGNLFKKIEKKMVSLSKLSQQKNQIAQSYCDDVEKIFSSYREKLISEMKKYQAALNKIKNNKEIIVVTKKQLIRRGYIVLIRNPLQKQFYELIELTDQLIVLLVILHNSGQCFEKGTMRVVKYKLIKSLNNVLGKINAITLLIV